MPSGVRGQRMDEWKRRWGVGQWAAFFESQELPVLRRSKQMLAAFEEANLGLAETETRANTAAQVAMRWAAGRNDLNPEEVAVASLLVDAGELLLWVYEPELPQSARDELFFGRARRSSQAQMQACGFDFKQLTIRCAELWKLPTLVVQLLRGADSPRANLTRICSNLARHIVESSDTSDLALACDLLEVQKLMPGASLEWLAEGLVMLPEQKRGELVELANGRLAHSSSA